MLEQSLSHRKINGESANRETAPVFSTLHHIILVHHACNGGQVFALQYLERSQICKRGICSMQATTYLPNLSTNFTLRIHKSSFTKLHNGVG
jgi:hypothetical protein